MNPGNSFVAVPAEGEEAPAPRSYDELVAEASFQPYEVGKALYLEGKDVPWAIALAVTEKAHLDEDATAAHSRLLMGSYADSLTPAYFLVITGGYVRVLYGWKPCRPLDPEGRRFAGLLSERVVSAGGAELPPKLYVTHTDDNQRQHQHRAFSRNHGRPASIGTIMAAYQADGDAVFIAQPPTVDGVQPAQVSAWRALPVHPKVACLYLRGLPLRQAFNLTVELARSIPEPQHSLLNGLLNFMRLAVFEDGGASVLSNDWIRQDERANTALEGWYLSLCDGFAPKYRPSAGPAPVAPVGAPTAAATVVAAVPKEKEPYRRAFTQAELDRLYNLCGVSDMVEDDLTSEALPPFWREFEGLRGKFHSARSHVETWLDRQWPVDAPTYQRFISTTFLKDLVALDFDGQDAGLLWTKRNEGFSIFVIYPLADHADPGTNRRRAKAYEDTMDNHAPSDRVAMESQDGGDLSIPSNRTELWRWLQYFEAATQTIFGDGCPMLPYLRRIKRIVGNGTPSRHHGPDEWRACFWKYHCAVRAFFAPSGGAAEKEQPFKDLIYRMRQGQPVSPREVPPELCQHRPSHQVPIPGGGGGNRSGGGGSGDPPPRRGGGPRDTPSQLSIDTANQWARTLAPKLAKAKEALLRAGKEWNMGVLYRGKNTESFGDMVNLLAPGSGGHKSPCPRMFTYGVCKAKSCRASHNLTRAPSSGQGKKYLDWVEARCATIISDPSKA